MATERCPGRPFGRGARARSPPQSVGFGKIHLAKHSRGRLCHIKLVQYQSLSIAFRLRD
jgi:hypothetical protein